MNDKPHSRPTPSFGSTQVHAGAKETAQPGPMQPPAAPMQKDAVTPPKEADFTVSVEEIRTRLHTIGISKSKDTIQRYCREGELDCLKLGMFKRYYVTEASVEKLIKKLQTDEAAPNSTQVHEAAPNATGEPTQVHAGAPKENAPETKDPHETAFNPMHPRAPARAPDLEEEPLVMELRATIGRLEKGTDFLQEELIDRRKQTKALSAVIDAFQKNAETNHLVALAEQAEREASAKQDKKHHYTATTVKADDQPTAEETDTVGENGETKTFSA